MEANALAKIGMIMQATGMGLKGQDGSAVYKRYADEQESAKRKEAIGGIMDRLNISGPKRDFLSTLPLETAQELMWEMMNPAPVEGKVVGNKLINPYDGSVIGDYADPGIANGDFLAALTGSESGGNPSVINGEGYGGLLQFGQERLDDWSNANGTPRISVEEFAANPGLQHGVNAWHLNDLSKEADKYAQYYGMEFNGVPLTREGAMAIAHLGGKGGLARYVQSGGQYNPADSNGTRLSDYQRKFAGTTYGGQQAGPDNSRRIAALERARLDPRLNDQQREYLDREIERLQPEKSEIAALEARAREGGLKKGSPEYRKFMLDGGSEKGMLLEVDAQGNTRFATGSAAGNAKPFTEAQSKDNVFFTRATGALEVLDPIADELTSRWQRLADMDPTGLAREMQTEEFQVAVQAGDEFLQAILRKDTGAAITVPEQYLYGKTYLPRPGDGPAVLAAKKRARARAVAGIKSGMSPSQILAAENALGEVEAARTQAPPEAGASEQPAAAEAVEIDGFSIRKVK